MVESQDLFQSDLIDDVDDLLDDIYQQDLVKRDEEELDGSVQEVAAGTSETSVENQQVVTEKQFSKFPLARIKAIMKLDPELQLVSQESVFLIARATELFLQNLAKETYTYTAKAKRKTVQKKDVETAIENIDNLCFLEGALDNN